MQLTKDQLPQSTMFAAEIELTFDPNNDHEIWAPEDHAIALEPVLRSSGISSFNRRPLITSSSSYLRDLHSIFVSGTVARTTLVAAVRTYFTQASISWHEPYAESADMEHFRFLLPYDPIYK